MSDNPLTIKRPLFWAAIMFAGLAPMCFVTAVYPAFNLIVVGSFLFSFIPIGVALAEKSWLKTLWWLLLIVLVAAVVFAFGSNPRDPATVIILDALIRFFVFYLLFTCVVAAFGWLQHFRRWRKPESISSASKELALSEDQRQDLDNRVAELEARPNDVSIWEEIRTRGRND